LQGVVIYDKVFLLMSSFNAARFVEEHPEMANEAFARVEGALNLVLPGSDTHARYQGIEEVGLAVVVGRDADPPLSFNPFDPATPTRLSFMADNRQLRPGAWEPSSKDKMILGGAVPESMGRFTAYALAKINQIAGSERIVSYDPRKVSNETGRIGLAGAKWLDGALVGASGLWEVHDHVAPESLPMNLLARRQERLLT
jgi:hypothetical protein